MDIIFLQNTVFAGEYYHAGETAKMDAAVANRFISAKLAAAKTTKGKKAAAK